MSAARAVKSHYGAEESELEPTDNKLTEIIAFNISTVNLSEQKYIVVY